MGPTAARHLFPKACAVLVLLQIGSPGFGALERAISQIFDPEANWLAPATEPAVDRTRDQVAMRLFSPAVDRLGPSAEQVRDADTRPTALQACSSRELCDSDVPPQPFPVAPTWQAEKRGVLVPLYASFAVLQALDVHSTLFALDRGNVETNPLAAGLVNRPAAFIAFKAATVVGTIYLAEQIRPHSRVGAIVVMGALNSMYAIVVAHNYRLAR